MTQDLEKLKEWIGRTESDIDYVTVPAVHRLAATLDRADAMPKMGDPLPVGWHQILFPRVVRHSQIGADGHPERGDFLPPVPLPRRMFAGKRTTFHESLRVGDEVHRHSVIKEVNIKQGRTGQMVFVTVKTDIPPARHSNHRGNDSSIAKPPGGTPPRRRSRPGKRVERRGHARPCDASGLGRSRSRNRIHYEQPYVYEVSGYPGRVMNAG